MKKIYKLKSFSLIELMISIFILSLIVISMFSTLDNLNLYNDKLENSMKKYYLENKIIEIIKKDFQLNNYNKEINTNIKNQKIDFIQFRSSNSLYGLNNPYIIYYVHKKNNTLIRIETLNKIIFPFKLEEHFYLQNSFYDDEKGFNEFYIDVLIENIEVFKLQQKKDNNNKSKKDNFLILIKTANEDFKYISTI